MKITVAVALFFAVLFAPLLGVQAQIVKQPFPAALPGSRTTGLGILIFNPVKDHGADPTGVVDAAAAIQASQADCAAAGGGEVRIDNARLLFNSGDITIARNCPIVGSWVPQPIQTIYRTAVSALVHDSAHNLNVGAGARMSGVLVLNSGLPAVPTTFAQGAAMVAGFAGTGVTATGTGTILRDVQTGGFALGVSSSGFSQHRWSNVVSDDTACYSVVNSHDQSAIAGFECWPFLTASQSWTKASANVSAAADNGSGKIRLTVASTANFTTGNTLFPAAVGGYTGANSPCVNATVVDATHIDCPSLSSAPTATAALVSGSNVLTLTAADPSIHTGQTVTDSTTGGNIPGVTTVTFVSGTRVYMSAAATGSGASDTVAFANGAYTSGGTVSLSNDYRAGTGVYGEGNALLQCSQCNVYGHATGLDLNGDTTDTFSDFAVDNDPALADPTAVGYNIRGASYGNKINGSYVVAGQPIIHNSSAAQPNAITVTRLYNTAPTASPTIAALSGVAMVNNSGIQQGAHIYTDASVTRVQYCGDDFTPATFYWQSVTAKVRGWPCPGIRSAAGVGMPNTGHFTPGNPVGTTSATNVMMGFGGTATFTPLTTGRVLIKFDGEVSNATATNSTVVSFNYGTGAAPANGDAASGTLCPSGSEVVTRFVVGSGYIPVSLTCIASLTPGTTYWLDAPLKVTGGTLGTLINAQISVTELQ